MQQHAVSILYSVLAVAVSACQSAERLATRTELHKTGKCLLTWFRRMRLKSGLNTRRIGALRHPHC